MYKQIVYKQIENESFQKKLRIYKSQTFTFENIFVNAKI